MSPSIFLFGFLVPLLSSVQALPYLEKAALDLLPRTPQFPGRIGFGAPFDDDGCRQILKPTQYRHEIECSYVDGAWSDQDPQQKKGKHNRRDPNPEPAPPGFGVTAGLTKPVVERSEYPLARAIAAIGGTLDNVTAIILSGPHDNTTARAVVGLSGVLKGPLTFYDKHFRVGAAWIIRWDFSWYGKEPEFIRDQFGFLSPFSAEGRQMPATGILGPHLRLAIVGGRWGEIRVDKAIYWTKDSEPGQIYKSRHMGDDFLYKFLMPQNAVSKYLGPDQGFGSPPTKEPEKLLAAEWMRQQALITPAMMVNITAKEGWNA